MLKIFLSCVSAQFKECRDALASDLRAIGCEVRVQEDFQQGPRTLIERLEEYVAQCDRVVALVGDAYGYEASGDAVAAVDPPRSYTQWEWFFTMGERLDGSRDERKDLYLYFASDHFLRDHPVRQSTEHAERQRAFVASVKATGEHWAAFDSVDQLCRLVLRDGWRMNERPPRPSNLPYDSIGTLFKGRERFLEELHERLRREPTRAAAIVSKQAIHGLGGVGKTRLAIEYALRYEAEYSALLFVMADAPEALRRNVAALCGPLVLNLPEQEAREEDARVAAALRWLHGHSGWLLVLDNVDTRAAAGEVEGLLGQLQGGHVLVTSRLGDWSAGVEALELDVLGEDDSVAFLLERTSGRRRSTPTDEADARALARELDGLALALEQRGHGTLGYARSRHVQRSGMSSDTRSALETRC